MKDFMSVLGVRRLESRLVKVKGSQNVVSPSARPTRSGKPTSDGAMRYSPFQDDCGRMHEPQDRSQDTCEDFKECTK